MAQTLLATERPIAARRGNSVAKWFIGSVAFVLALPLVALYQLGQRGTGRATPRA